MVGVDSNHFHIVVEQKKELDDVGVMLRVGILGRTLYKLEAITFNPNTYHVYRFFQGNLDDIKRFNFFCKFCRP